MNLLRTRGSFQLVILGLLLLPSMSLAQENDSIFIRKIYTEALTKGHSYENLRLLCKEIGPRLSGSENANKAVFWTKSLMESYGFDSVWLQPVMVPKWVRGRQEKAKVFSKEGNSSINITSLGNSEGTGKKGVKAEVVEVKSLDELKEKGEAVKGKIVFINEPMSLFNVNTFTSYGETGIIRHSGPREAAKLGAIGVLVRSLNTYIDDYPHTGTTSYGLNVPKIPAVAISTSDAEMLSELIKKDDNVRIFFRNESHLMEEKVQSYNVIGEIRGSEFPKEIIVFGGHLDSWDLAEGAHDDGAGVIHAIESARILKENYAPKRTLRVVLFMNEENGLAGGKEYADAAFEHGEKHLAGLESDSGGFIPLGFSIDADDATIQKLRSWAPLFKPYNIFVFDKGYGGADINPLKTQEVPVIGLRVDSQRYFEIHHSAKDVFENVNKRELELGSATMASLIYLMDKYGL